jgi:hypothetical protein
LSSASPAATPLRLLDEPGAFLAEASHFRSEVARRGGVLVGAH